MADATAQPDPSSSDWHLRDAAEVLQAQHTDPATGLSTDEAARRLARHGANALATQQARPWPALLLDQFTDFMILVLLAAAVVSGLLGEWEFTPRDIARSARKLKRKLGLKKEEN